MQAIDGSLQRLLKALPPPPVERGTLDELVSSAIAEVESKTSADNRRTQWEYALRNEVFTLAATEGVALKGQPSAYYDGLKLRLDVVLAFTEKDACDQTFPFNLLYDLLETQTIPSCSHIFSWIESRADRLTENMVPQKGKALILLRTLNDLLRRLSKMGSTTLFCGRILTFLSQVFPLGERSGVNLRGEYGPTWDGPGVKKDEPEDVKMELTEEAKQSEDQMQVDEGAKEGKKEEAKEEVKGSPTPAEKKQQQKDEFYRTFWSLQLPFSRPSVFTEPHTFEQFKVSVNKVLPVIKEATAKERALMGSKANSGSSHKRRREPEVNIDAANQGYFFSKYLTSPELLDLEIADTHFRRQFLFQLLILLNHLLTFTRTAKASWSTPRNRSLQMDFTLGPDDEKWVHETVQKTSEELRQTTPNGRVFAETVAVILEREKNWIRWKNELCTPFDKAPWVQEVDVEVNGELVKKRIGLEEATRDVRRKLMEDPEEFPHSHGTAALTEIWEMGWRDMSDLERPFQPGDVHDFVRKVKQEDARIEMRKKQLAKQAERIAQARAKAIAASTAASTVASPAPAASTPSHEPAPAPASAAAPSPAPTPVPLHPSLPAKPGTLPPKPSSTPVPESAPAPIVAPKPTPAAPPPVVVPPEPVLPPDPQIQQYEENKQRWSWLALRVAREKYLRLFGAIGTGDILLLTKAMEDERKKIAEEAANPNKGDKEEAVAGSQSAVSIADSKGDLTASESVTAAPSPEKSEALPEEGKSVVEEAVAMEDAKPVVAQDGEGDVKMDG